MKKLLALTIFVTVFLAASYAHAAVYYFNNAVNTDPTELGNYWYDQNEREVPPSDPALELPDLSVDEVTILDDAVYDGDIVFNGSAENRGTVGDAEFKDGATNSGVVNGNAIFFNSGTANDGIVSGTKTRRYTVGDTSTNDFRGWTVVADGVEVDVTTATYDGTTIFSEINGGLFVYAIPMLRAAFIADEETIRLVYDRTLNEASVPIASDYHVEVFGNTVSLASVVIESNSVELRLSSPINISDILTIEYVVGTNPVKGTPEGSASSFSDQYAIHGVEVGINPSYIAVAGPGKKIYTTDDTGNTISVVDSNTYQGIETISIGERPNFITSISNKLYVTSFANDSVSVIDTVTDAVIETIPVGGQPYSSVVSGNKVYVNNAEDDTVSVIDTVSDTVVATIPVGDTPHYAATIGTKVYVANFGDASISVIDTVTDTVTTTIPVGNGVSYTLVFIGEKLYTTNVADHTVSVIDTTTDTVVTTISGFTTPLYAIAYGSTLYVANSIGTVSVVNTLTDTITATIPIGEDPYYVFLLRKKVLIGNQTSNSSSVINTQSNSVSDTIPVGNTPTYLADKYSFLYVTNYYSNTISIIDSDTLPSLLPNLTSFSTSSPSGTYTPGQSISIQANFGRPLAPGSTMTILMNTGRSVTLNNVSGSTLSGTYIIQAGDTTPDLAVRSITSANVSDNNGHTRTSYDLPSSVGDFEAENSFITRSLGDSTNIKIGGYQSFTTGNNPYQLTAPINGFLYVANQGAGTVSVINATTGALADTIDVGDEPYGLAVVGTELYVANTGSDTVSVINTATNAVTYTINVGVKPYYVATIGTNVYVTNSLSNTVSVIDTATHAVTDTIPVGSYPRGIKAYGTDLYVANYGDPNYSGGNYISVIDSLTNEVSDTIILPAGSDGPRGVTTVGDKVYVSNFRSNDISVIDTATNEITDTIDVGTGPRGLLGTGTTLYVENFDDGTISVIDTNSNIVTDTVDVGHSPSGISLSGTTLYITSFQDDRVYALDTTTNELIIGVDDQEEETETPPKSSGSRTKYVQFTTEVPPTLPSPDCLPAYKFSPSTGNPCPISSSPTPSVSPITPATSSIPSPFTRDLKLNMLGPDVLALQKYLNTHGFPVALTGPGSKGFETTKFGSLTHKALIKFQIANKITPAVGYFGPKTRGVVNANAY